MILVDANLLLYAQFTNFPRHAEARRWLEDRLNSPGRVGNGLTICSADADFARFPGVSWLNPLMP